MRGLAKVFSEYIYTVNLHSGLDAWKTSNKRTRHSIYSNYYNKTGLYTSTSQYSHRYYQ